MSVLQSTEPFFNESTVAPSFRELHDLVELNKAVRPSTVSRIEDKTAKLIDAKTRGIITPDDFEENHLKLAKELQKILIKAKAKPPPTIYAFEPMVKTVLIYSSSPKGVSDVRWNNEISQIQSAHRGSTYRSDYDIKLKLTTTKDEFYDGLLRETPHIVHFIGHGSKDGLYFEKSDGRHHLYKSEQLKNIFRLYVNKIHCVFFNSCFSAAQSVVLNNLFPFTIGMDYKIEIDTALKFSEIFYKSYFESSDVSASFYIARESLVDDGLEESKLPLLIEKEYTFQNSIIDPSTIAEVFSLDPQEKIALNVIYHLGVSNWEMCLMERIQEKALINDEELRDAIRGNPGILKSKIRLGSGPYVGLTPNARAIWNQNFE